ncbi:MAG: YezD family protein [Pirellulales bacterium]
MSSQESRRHDGPGNGPHEVPQSAGGDAPLRRIGDALHGLRYGSVLAIVQDGVVVQIERTEKTRFGK